MIEGDSAEYEFLTEAVELSRDVEGMCCEIGLRRGMGTKTIIDAVRHFCPTKTVVAIDPYGSIPYIGREHMGECRLDYTNQMKSDCMADLWAYVRDNPVSFRYEEMRSEEYFSRFIDHVTIHDLEPKFQRLYSMAHLDGVHTVKAISREVIWFNDRMDSGACICVDDVTIDFVDIRPIQELFTRLGWEQVKMGLKKGLWRKK